MNRLVVSLLLLLALACSKQRPIVIGSKNFTESVLLGELVAQTLEAKGCKVDRRLNMGGTFVCDAALRAGSIDAYVEYSGTALTAILKQPASNDRDAVNRAVRAAYAKEGLHWSPALGFDNTFAMIVRKSTATQQNLTKISDLKRLESTLRPGFGYEFTERPDGWTGLQQAYGLNVRQAPRSMDLGLTYKALATGEIDLIAGNSTDGLIDSLGLVILDDDRRFFPPYEAVVVRRGDLDVRCKGASAAIEALAGTIDDGAMRRLNYEVDGRKRDVAIVIREWLSSR